MLAQAGLVLLRLMRIVCVLMSLFALLVMFCLFGMSFIAKAVVLAQMCVCGWLQYMLLPRVDGFCFAAWQCAGPTWVSALVIDAHCMCANGPVCIACYVVYIWHELHCDGSGLTELRCGVQLSSTAGRITVLACL